MNDDTDQVKCEPKKHQHAEAFCLMQYRCKQCGIIDLFWNSRDGVTPFVVSGRCLVCQGDMIHINWGQDAYRPDHIPESGQGVFFDMPESFKRPVANWRLSRAEGTPFELQGEDREQMKETIIQGFQPGAPWFIRW